MSRSDLDERFRKIDVLISEINNSVPPNSSYSVVEMRADLAGLLVVAMAATYETCVKEILCSHANAKHAAFGSFATRHFERLNSRIRVNNLIEYCELFDPSMKQKFKTLLTSRKKVISERTGKNIESSYNQILDWRHGFAHAWNRNTTIEEAAETHKVGKRVLYVFDRAFSAD